MKYLLPLLLGLTSISTKAIAQEFVWNKTCPVHEYFWCEYSPTDPYKNGLIIKRCPGESAIVNYILPEVLLVSLAELESFTLVEGLLPGAVFPDGTTRVTWKATFDCNDFEVLCELYYSFDVIVSTGENIVVYPDNDHDGYGDLYSDPIVKGCVFADFDMDGLSLVKGDFNDNDPLVWKRTVVAADFDHDGYGSLDEFYFVEWGDAWPEGIPQPGVTPGYINMASTRTGWDCDDNDPKITERYWYLDEDHDGYPAQVVYPRPVNTRYIRGSLYRVGSCTSPGPNYIPVTDPNVMPTFDCNDNDPLKNPGQNWYLDNDGDGYGKDILSGGIFVQQCERPEGKYFAPGELKGLNDCNDNDATINPETIWYVDADNDGYSNLSTVIGCSRPSNYKLGSELKSMDEDCNDKDPVLNPGTEWYLDFDNDGYYTSIQIGGRKQCTSPGTGWKFTGLLGGGDCRDDDATVNPTTIWYRDTDGDNYYDPSYIGLPSCSIPGPNFKNSGLLGPDCNDNDATYNPETIWVVDKDGDGYYSGNPIIGCLLFGGPTGVTRKTTQLPGDCDDNNSAIHAGPTWYKDADNDGYSDGTTTIQCTQPLGYKLATALTATSGDCNDGDAATNPGTTWLFDGDNDGYYSGFYIGSASCTSPGPGWKHYAEFTNGPDCDDNDPAIMGARVWYKDTDNDGYGTGAALTQCTRPASYKLASELTATSGDCDDNNPILKPTTVWYKDADNDGYSDGASQTQCTRPTNYKLASELTAANVDCNDGDATINPNTKWYKDADNDGYSDGTIVTQCVKPTGYKLASALTALAGDCNDNDATVRSVAILGASPDIVVLSPPNHKFRDVTINYTTTNNCGNPTTTLSVSSNEPISGTGDGDTSPDWQVVDNHHVRLRAEMGRGGQGRVYTITITATDASGNTATTSVTVRVAHNITSPPSGQPFKVGSTVNFTGVFWDKPGSKHTANWNIDDNTTVKGTITEPTATKNGTVTGSYKFSTPGVYKLQMNTIDQSNVVSYATTNGDLEEIIVIYDPNGGYAYGGGWFDSPAGALTSDAQATGKVSYGFSVNYYKGATLPKGETQFEFKVGDLEYNALNFDYLSVSGYKAVFKGSGKIIGGQSGINFMMYVTDGALDGTGVDKVRIKIYNKNTGQVYYDNQPGANDTANPTTAVGSGSTVVISGIATVGTNTGAQAVVTAEQKPTNESLNIRALPNPTSTNFKLIVNRINQNTEIKMVVVDMYGRMIEQRMLPNEQTITLGDKYRPGVYIVKFTQGEQTEQLKLIKLPN